VSVDHAPRMGVLEGAADLLADAQHLVDRQALAFGPPEGVLDGAAGHELADDVDLPAVVAHVVHGGDVGMITESPHGARLPLHAAAPGLVEPLGLDDRDGDVAFEAGIVGEVDALLGSLAEEPSHLVAAGGQGARHRGRGGFGSRARDRRAAAVTEACAGPQRGVALGTYDFHAPLSGGETPNTCTVQPGSASVARGARARVV